ncbi:peptidylprolyl isomerase [Massilia sp. W12]|uniref:peptidylprolyl isomerase n=1 Tax=Massilia sp. W12 TaxID=3126507 RepID=UPI0030CE21E6
MNKSLLALAAMLCVSLTHAAPSKLSMSEVLQQSADAEWRTVDPEQTLYLELDKGRVVIELAPQFAPRHVENVKTLVREGYFDGLSVMRVQENYVVQWGDPDEKNPRQMKQGKRQLAPEFSVAAKPEQRFVRLPDRDGYAAQVGHADGMPAGYDPKTRQTWLAHCYGMVGAGRDMAADSGSGAEMYVVIGHAPRHLDRNVTLFGRVLQGMPLLTTLPRGTAALGFYDKPEQFVKINAVRVAADVAPEQRVKLQVLKSESASFKKAVEALRNRGGDWYKAPAGHVELCNVPLMVREQK